MLAAGFGLLAPLCAADNNSRITLDTSETVFAVLTAMNTCGYNVDLNISDAQRLNIRAEVEKNLRSSADAQTVTNTMCEWYPVSYTHLDVYKRQLEGWALHLMKRIQMTIGSGLPNPQRTKAEG